MNISRFSTAVIYVGTLVDKSGQDRVGLRVLYTGLECVLNISTQYLQKYDYQSSYSILIANPFISLYYPALFKIRKLQ